MIKEDEFQMKYLSASNKWNNMWYEKQGYSVFQVPKMYKPLFILFVIVKLYAELLFSNKAVGPFLIRKGGPGFSCEHYLVCYSSVTADFKYYQ